MVRTVDVLERWVRELAGTSALLERTSYAGGLNMLSVSPLNPKARRLNVIGQQWLQVEAGEHGGCWELSYTADDIELARQIIEAVIHGRVVELVFLRRSEVRVELSNGQQVSQTGYGTGLGWLPIPGWRRRARTVIYEPYRSTIDG